ncbi:hypothetical protein R69608_07899 [Paraburkholderia nemoris]|uniref:Uncharacterized protein n=1 Tax=Paraburkholderia nemoris TaxID=2793076 RepID=A0ABM8T7I0_9BURK|nr:hypothetical protein R69619_07808 [Paraburkholderia nemoris]CAE6861497.1 hypothetical protein R75777_08055 [Paraburkholderia nemoris]CAE6864343.1 hypothetical protein R69776_08174 [Paraburkholderia nemoris]CAE6972987.1 hypothetical protein R69608_07899 [Paraburkholderia nemoris]
MQRHVEVDRRRLQQRVLRRDPVGADEVVQVQRQRALAYRYALGSSGRAGRVDHIGKLLRVDRCGAFAQRAQGSRCVRPGTSAGNRSGRFVKLLIRLLIELLIKLRIGRLIQLLTAMLTGLPICLFIGLLTSRPISLFLGVLINLPSLLPNSHLHAALQHRRQLHRTRCIDNDAAHPRVLNHVAQPRFRIRRVQRHLRRARLPDPQQRRGQSRRALQAHPHPVLVRDTRTHQRHTQSVRPRVELRIAEPFIAAYHGLPVAAHLRTRLETCNRRHIRVRRTLRRALSTRTRPHRQLAQTPLARRTHLLQQLHVVTTHPFNRRRIEQPRIPRPLDLDALARQDRKSQRVMRRIHRLRRDDFQRATLVPRGLVDRIVFEHEQRVE